MNISFFLFNLIKIQYNIVFIITVVDIDKFNSIPQDNSSFRVFFKAVNLVELFPSPFIVFLILLQLSAGRKYRPIISSASITVQKLHTIQEVDRQIMRYHFRKKKK